VLPRCRPPTPLVPSHASLVPCLVQSSVMFDWISVGQQPRIRTSPPFALAETTAPRNTHLPVVRLLAIPHCLFTLCIVRRAHPPPHSWRRLCSTEGPDCPHSTWPCCRPCVGTTSWVVPCSTRCPCSLTRPPCTWMDYLGTFLAHILPTIPPPASTPTHTPRWMCGL
jgi:hypothetical protein